LKVFKSDKRASKFSVFGEKEEILFLKKSVTDFIEKLLIKSAIIKNINHFYLRKKQKLKINKK